MGLLFEKLKARQKPDGTFTPAPAEDTPMLVRFFVKCSSTGISR